VDAPPENHDITVTLLHEERRRVVAVRPGAATVLRVEISNSGALGRELALAAEGLPPALCRISPAGTVRVAPGGAPVRRELIIEVADTVPVAGRRDLSVTATDTSSSHDAILRWRSERKSLDVLAQPKLALKLVSPAERIGESAAYRATVRVSNRGNVRLDGAVSPPDAAWLAAHQPSRDDVRLVDSSWVRCGDGFMLEPGAFADLAVEVRFPAQGWRSRLWEVVVLPVATGRNDVMRTIDGPLRVRQHGRLADLLAVAGRARRAASAFRRFGAWCSRPAQTRRGALVAVPAAVIIALAAGMGLGVAVAGTEGPPAESAGTAASASGSARQATELAMDECRQMLDWHTEGYIQWAQRVLDRTWLASHPQSNPRPLRADGRLGPRTTAVLMDFQRGHGLPPTGQFDPGTRAKLLDAARRAGPRQLPPTPSAQPVAGARPVDLCRDLLQD
jgi:Putative peptidoglycan binding domain